MNLDEMKKASEVFNNIAQPLATLIAAYIGSKVVSNKKKKPKKVKKKKWGIPSFSSDSI